LWAEGITVVLALDCQSYINSHFPRVVELTSAALDGERALMTTMESEKFLRIVIEMWLERNSVYNPDMKQPDQVEPSDTENKLVDLFIPPTVDSLHGLILLTSHLLGRKVEVEAAVLKLKRRPNPLRSCPALMALHQPLFIMLALIFRNLKLSAEHAVEFFLSVDLWLTLLEPGKVLAKLGWNNPDAGKLWRENLLKEHVESHYHFYSTLLVLFLRKVVELLGSGTCRQEVALGLIERVLKVYKERDLDNALREACQKVDDFKCNRGGRHMELIHAHEVALRLTRSKACHLWDPQNKKDADNLRAELHKTKLQFERALRENQLWVAKLKKLVDRAIAPFVEDGYYDASQVEQPDDIPKLIDKVSLARGR
jgi:hypothetical protein